MLRPTARTPIRVPKMPRSRPQSCEEKQQQQQQQKQRDSVSVFCRVRPLQAESDLSCIRVKNSTTVILTPPEYAVNYKLNTQKETQYIFKHVFEPNTKQSDVFDAVAKPLVENLIRGKNSLLFTYGVTGSGKTYTMTGNARQRGIMPRCLDSLFRTISDYQAKKYIFKPDRLNGFEILSEADALLERQAEMNQRFVGGGKNARLKDSDSDIASQASCDVPPIEGLDEDNMFAVFITYVEVYNNSVYDLLEQGGIQKTLQSKIIREDANHNMYVHSVTEIEIKTVEEAIEAFQSGQKRKRMGHTVLNAESSRSHSVFSVRLVQAPTDSQGENVIQDKRIINISQLSLVDLAGSERSSRTKNTGVRLREAGNINNSLMTLRTCLEYLRENQQAQSNGMPTKKVPYRDSKITHMFKNYFDGEGLVSMIVCVNPRGEDYDENSQVMKFAEMTQEVQIARATPMKPDIGLTPGRRKAHKIFKMAVNNLNDLGYPDAKKLDVDVGLVYTLGPGFPDYKIDSPEGANTIQDLMQYLSQRIEKRKILRDDLENRCDNFRSHLMQMEKENFSLKTELASLKAIYTQERERAQALDSKMRVHESSIDLLSSKLSNRERQIDELTRKLAETQNLLAQKEQEKEKQKMKFNAKLAVETDKKSRELEMKWREQRQKIEEKMRAKDIKLRLVSNIISNKDRNIARSRSTEDILEEKNGQDEQPKQHQQEQHLQHNQIVIEKGQSERTNVYCTPRRPRGPVAANIRHRRSRSTGDKWLEHRAPNPVPLGTILQPYLKNRKSVTKLTDIRDLTEKNTTRYCLVSQEADTDGDVETKLYKGNVIPTCGGGAQVIFDDVEHLKQKSPVTSTPRKRHSTENDSFLNNTSGLFNNAKTLQDVSSRCNIGLEGHSSKRTKM